MQEQQASYRQIMKATSLFGGVQVFGILIGIIRSKFLAVLLGPAGIGIAGLLGSTIGLISGLTNFGLGTSAIKSVASASGTGNQDRVAIVITVLRRWMWVTGLLGMIFTLISAPLLSRMTFGNTEYTLSFIWVSVSLLLAQLSSGQMILLQGLRKLQYLAKANLTGSILGLILTVPLYYLFGIKGIIPAIIITSSITLCCSWFFAQKIAIKKVKVSKVIFFAEGKDMLKMGFMISLSGLITLGTSYIVRIFISNHGGVLQVGLYSAGFAIVNNYVGLIFSAMGTDYYPRLSAVAHSNSECKKIINQQGEIAILIMAPLIILFLVFINWIVIILYSSQFVSVNRMILWAALGMLFKAVTWAVGYLFLAKGASKIFFWSEIVSNAYTLILNLIGYYYWGLSGLGISFLVAYIISIGQVFFIAKIFFDFDFQKEMYNIFFIQFSLALISFLVSLLIGGFVSYVLGTAIFLISFVYSVRELDKRLGLTIIFENLKSKYIK